jgi:ribonuclease HI
MNRTRMVVLDYIQQNGGFKTHKKKARKDVFKGKKKKYSFQKKKSKMSFSSSATKTIRVFTDGSVLFNVRSKIGGIGGIGVYFEDSTFQHLQCSEAFLCAPVTNIRAEIFACIRCVEQVLRYMDTHSIDDKWTIRIITDSEFFINVMTKWIEGWKRKNWKKADGDDVQNIDLIYWFDSLLHIHRDRIRVEYQHVKSHRDPPKMKDSEEYANWYGNHQADTLARKASMQQHKMMGGQLEITTTDSTQPSEKPASSTKKASFSKKKKGNASTTDQLEQHMQLLSASNSSTSVSASKQRSHSADRNIGASAPVYRTHHEPSIMDTVVTSKRDKKFKSKRITDFWNGSVDLTE